MKILIVGDSVGGLAAARDLGAGGWTVGLACARRRGLIGLSRHVDTWHRVAPPFGDLDPFVDAINAAVAEKGYELLLGVGEAEVLALSAVRDRLHAQVPYTDHAKVLRGIDKLSLNGEARAAGLATPHTVIADADALTAFSLPVAVKARLHWIPGAEHRRIDAAIAHSRDDALELAAAMRAKGAEPLFQEFVSGRVLHFVALCARGGGIVSTACHETTRLGASGSGQSARAVTVTADPQLAAGVQRFLGNLDWFGMADLQFWVQDDGAALLTDFNGRIYGALSLPVAAGWNGADAWGRLALGQAVDLLPARAGVRYQSMEGELRQAVSRKSPARMAACLSYAFTAHHPVWQARDPMPGLGYLATKVRRLVSGEMDLSGR